MLDLNGLSKHFGALRVIDNLSLTAAADEVLGLIGPNGAGKTTLFNVIAGVQAATAGVVAFDGRVINRMKVWDRCRLGIARTYQIPKPFTHMSVFENVLCAALHGGGLSGGQASHKAGEVLETVALSRHAETPARDLSLLDLKRLELAKALACNPRLLLLDEIAGGLTEAECDALLDIVRGIHSCGVTIVWIEHVIHALRRIADRIAVLHGGAIIASGTPDSVLSDARVREVYLGTES